MNFINKLKTGTLLVIAAGTFSACTKTFDEKVTQLRDFSSSSLLQLYNGTLSTTRNYVYVDSKPLNGAAIAYGGIFPGTGNGFAVPIGQKSFLIRDTLTTSVQPQLSFAQNLQSGKYYTIFMYDTLNAVKQKTVETAIVVPEDTSARIRFANFVFSKNAIPAVDIYSRKKGTNIFTNIPVTDVTAYIPYPSGITDTLAVRATGTTTDLTLLNGITPTAKRSYTIIFRGRYETTSGTVARTLTSFVNY